MMTIAIVLLIAGVTVAIIGTIEDEEKIAIGGLALFVIGSLVAMFAG